MHARYIRAMRPRSGMLVDTVVALAALGATLGTLRIEAAQPDGREVDVAAIALSLLATIPLVAVRRAPLTVFAVTVLASVALAIVVNPPGPPFGPTVALYWVAVGAGGSGPPPPLSFAGAVAAPLPPPARGAVPQGAGAG